MCDHTRPKLIALALAGVWLSFCMASAFQVSQTPSPTVGEEPHTIPQWWFTARTEAVLADPLFPILEQQAREEILEQIDPKFARMKSKQRDLFLWNAETKYLPQIPKPTRIVIWSTAGPESSTTIRPSGELARALSASGHEVELRSVEIFGQFIVVNLAIRNHSDDPLPIDPRLFAIQVTSPKAASLRFEYPNRFIKETVDAAYNYDVHRKWYEISAMDKVLPGIDIMVKSALKQVPLARGDSVEGDVFFEGYRGAKAVMVRVYLADTVFEFPSVLKK